MSNMLAVDKQKICFQLPIRLVHRLDKMAAAAHLSRNEIVNAILEREAGKVELTEADLDKINQKIRKNIHARSAR